MEIYSSMQTIKVQCLKLYSSNINISMVVEQSNNLSYGIQYLRIIDLSKDIKYYNICIILVIF